MPTLASGQVIAERFIIESVAGSGGMGTVFRAHDSQTGGPIAIKILNLAGRGFHEVERFNREAQILSEIQHPGIVKYVGRGQTEQGQPFLAMEWLQGEDLAQHLRRAALSLTDSIALLRQSAEALATAHRLGIVHRDIKPSNIFLCAGEVGRVVLLDFGVARLLARSPTLTDTGMVIGTPEYMAPEQACGRRGILPSADIFSLGCVLFECLTGSPPFTSEHLAGILAKVLFEEAPPLRKLCPKVPAQLAALLARMLAKPPEQRPADATALLAELDALDMSLCSLEHAPSLGGALHSDSLLATEQQLCSVVIALASDSLHGRSVTLDTAEAERNEEHHLSLRAALVGLGARAESLADGSVVATLTGAVHATDQVALAAHCALLLKERWPEALVVLATGRGMVKDQLPVGEAIERATRLLHEPVTGATPDDSSGQQGTPMGVRLDELSASLLSGRFAVHRSEGSILLHSRSASLDETRPLLGQPTPCVGREQELRVLEVMLTGCTEESRACAVLLTASAGIGKSRLRHEFLRRLHARGIQLEIMVGRGDPIRAGAPYELLGQILRQLCDVQGSKEGATQQAKLRERLGRHLAPADGQGVVEFLGELCSVPFPDAQCAPLRAARRDPKAMADSITRAFIQWLRAECQQQPVLIVLEDLHWGDLLSIKLIEQVLRELSDQPLMVVALARPEVDQLFPKLWAGRVQELRIQGLGNRASEALIKQVLGQQVDRQVINRLVKQAAGNVLHLEELIRSAAEQKGDSTPASVLAMLQARVSRLGSGERRVLRAASIFGNSFWRGGIGWLLGQTYPAQQLDTWLDSLISEEVITRDRESRFAEDAQYGFRHALVRDAAYSLLTEPDRKLAHRLAGLFLEEAGEQDAMSLAEHFREADEPQRAVLWYTRAADRGIAGNDLDRAWWCVERASQCGAQGELLGVLRSLQCAIYFWRGSWAAAYPFGAEALPLLPPGCVRWCSTLGHLLVSAGSTGRGDEFARLSQMCTAATPEPDARSTYVESVAKLVVAFTMVGVRSAARGCLERISQLIDGTQSPDFECLGWLLLSRSSYGRSLEADPWGFMASVEAAADAFHRIGGVRNRLIAQAFMGMFQYEAGQPQTAEATLRNAAIAGQRLAEPLVTKGARAYLAWMLALQKDPERAAEAEALAREIVEEAGFFDGSTNTAHCALAILASATGDFSRAELHAVQACRNSMSMPIDQLQALTVLIRLRLLQGNTGMARASVVEGMGRLAQIECAGHTEVPFRLAAAEVYAAAGEMDAARSALQETLHQLEIRAAKAPDPALRASYLSALPENARALALARSWLGEDAVIAVQTGAAAASHFLR